MFDNAKTYSFSNDVAQYDAWYDSPKGQSIFESELACVQTLWGALRNDSVEVGVGTGRFAAALGVTDGIDPSTTMLARAVLRGIRGVLGVGERLPYRESSFDAVLMVMTICFLDDLSSALGECARVLRANGVLVVGFVPADSAWGQLYRARGSDGHGIYSQAHFFTAEQVIRMAAVAGFGTRGVMSTLLCPPEVLHEPGLQSQRGMVNGAGFLAVSLERGAATNHAPTNK